MENGRETVTSAHIIGLLCCAPLLRMPICTILIGVTANNTIASSDFVDL